MTRWMVWRDKTARRTWNVEQNVWTRPWLVAAKKGPNTVHSFATWEEAMCFANLMTRPLVHDRSWQ